jgi:transcription initiation factor TFIIIB Brf1 subunit/transcription initiation factor TFIIB
MPNQIPSNFTIKGRWKMVAEITGKIYDQIICPECNSNRIVRDNEWVCTNCGTVVDQVYVDSNFAISAKNPSLQRISQFVQPGNSVEKNDSLGSFIGYRSPSLILDSKHTPISPHSQELFKRLKEKYDIRYRIKNRETEFRILKILQNTGQILKLTPSVTKNAAYFYKKICKNEVKIPNHVSLIAFCIFYSIRIENRNAPITIGELSKVFLNLGHHVTPQLILRNGTFYRKYIDLSAKPKKSEDYLERLISSIINHPNLITRIRRKTNFTTLDEYKKSLYATSRELLEKLTDSIRGGRNPFILMGALIYCADKYLAKKFSSKSVLTQKIASEAMGIAEYSIRDHYVTLLKSLFIVKNCS